MNLSKIYLCEGGVGFEVGWMFARIPAVLTV